MKNIVHKTICSVFLILTLIAFGQNKVEGTSYTHFQIVTQNDSIDFIIADTNLDTVKPLLLFCQGSQPIPLFIDFADRGISPIPLNNFNLEELNKYYHVAVISMPKTPLIVKEENLNNQYAYVTDTSSPYSFSEEFQKADYFENYVNRANEVIEFLRKKDWIKSDKIVVAGHSQGARVAVGIASSNKNVSQLGLFGYDPSGRMHQSIRRIRKDAEAGKISWEQADSLQREEYELYERLQNPEFLKDNPSFISWKSFSQPTLDTLISLKIPVYIAYGSEDMGAEMCDLIPLKFIENSKKNYFIKRYPNLEHNFFPIDEEGKPNHSEGKWPSVMDEFIQWTNTAGNGDVE